MCLMQPVADKVMSGIKIQNHRLSAKSVCKRALDGNRTLFLGAGIARNIIHRPLVVLWCVIASTPYQGD